MNKLKIIILMMPMLLFSSDFIVNPAYSFMPQNMYHSSGEEKQVKIEYKYWSTKKIEEECIKVGFFDSLSTPPENLVQLFFSNYRCPEKNVRRRD